MAQRYNDPFDNDREDVNYDDVDLFDLSRRRKHMEDIQRSVEEDYDTYDSEIINGSSTGKRQHSANVTGQYPIEDNFDDEEFEETAYDGKVDNTCQNHTNKDIKKRKDKLISGNFVKYLLIAAVLCVIIGVALVYDAIGKINYVETSTKWSDVKAEEAPAWALRSENDVINVLLLGIDGDGGSNQRSDTIMILTLDGKSNVIKMTSILRDTYVFIPGRSKKTRINHAYAYGGAALTMQTVESNFRISIKRYIGIDMDGLSVVIEKLGGVDMELSAAEAKSINANVKGSTLTEGTQHLNGAQATYYARIRKIDSDFGRTGRQRKLIKAMLTSFKKLNVISQYSLLSEAAPYLTTNYSQTELMSIALKALSMMDSEMQEMSVPVSGTYQSKKISGMAVLVPNIEKNCREIHNFIFGSIPE